MNFPEKLQPSGKLKLDLPSGRTVGLWRATPNFRPWDGELPDDTYGGKAVLTANGEPAFAEIVILRLLEKAGWTGVWVDTFRRKYQTGYWQSRETITLPADRQRLLDDIHEEAGSTSGCFDIYCWKNDCVLFAEAKRKEHDSIRETQKRWVESALTTGVSLDSLLVVEWSIDDAV